MNALVLPDAMGIAVAGAGAYLLRRGRRRIDAADPAATAVLHHVVDAFGDGFRIGTRPGQPWTASIGAQPLFLRGFAFEGAAMAVALLDRLRPWTAPRLPQLLAAAPDYSYLIHVGAGWALAQAGAVEGARFAALDPVLRWLAIDGVGFHDGLMRSARDRAARRRALSPYGARAYDQGVGRSLWFTARGRPDGITRAIDGVDDSRRADLWSGVGLACAYAGGARAEELQRLDAACGSRHPHVAQGVMFAAEGHRRPAGGVPPHTALACDVICRMTAERAAAVARDEADALPPDGIEPAYEIWRSRVRARAV